MSRVRFLLRLASPGQRSSRLVNGVCPLRPGIFSQERFPPAVVGIPRVRGSSFGCCTHLTEYTHTTAMTPPVKVWGRKLFDTAQAEGVSLPFDM